MPSLHGPRLARSGTGEHRATGHPDPHHASHVCAVAVWAASSSAKAHSASFTAMMVWCGFKAGKVPGAGGNRWIDRKRKVNKSAGRGW